MVAYLAVHGGNGDIIAHGGLCVGDGDLAPDIVAVPLKNGVRPHVDGHPQVAGRSAVASAVALTAYRHRLSVVDPRRDIDRYRLVHLDTALAAALGALLLDDAAPAAAAGAGLLHLHYADGGLPPYRYLTGAVAVRTGLGGGALFGAAAAALAAVFQPAHLKLLGAALDRLHKGDGHLGRQVFPADRPVGVPDPAAAAKAPKAPAEDISEQVAQVAETAAETAAEAAGAGRAAAVAGVHARKAELVVALPLFLIGKHLVRLVDLLELGLGLLVAGVQVGVVFLCQLPEGLFDFFFAGALLQAQHFIVISFLCQYSHPLSQEFAEKNPLSSASRRRRGT